LIMSFLLKTISITVSLLSEISPYPYFPFLRHKPQSREDLL